MKKPPIEIAQQLFEEKYSGAQFLLLAGSIVRGEATKTSDLDIVVVYENIDCAYRDSYCFGDYPIEVFVHNLETLAYFFGLDKQVGVPSLANMVDEGIEVSKGNSLSNKAKNLAKEFIQKGPPSWEKDEIDRARYAITDMIEDMKDPRSRNELYATASDLYNNLATYFFRSQNLWSAKGKSIPRRMKLLDAEIAQLFNEAFADLFSTGATRTVFKITEKILEKEGGFLFDGYKLKAPKDWKKAINNPKD